MSKPIILVLEKGNLLKLAIYPRYFYEPQKYLFVFGFSVRTVPKLSISYLFMHGTRYYSLSPDLNKTVVLELDLLSLAISSSYKHFFCDQDATPNVYQLLNSVY